MRSYWIAMGLVMALFLGLFGLFAALDLPFLSDPRPWLEGGQRPLAAAIGFTLLVADVFLPIAASLVMVAHGAIFGIALGTLLSLAGGTAAAALAFAVGRWGGARFNRRIPADERRRAETLLGRWGELAVAASRPVPILAESLALLAGTTSLSWRRFLLAAAAGNLPIALLCAVTGATAARLDSFLLIFALVLVMAAAVWLAGRRLGRDASATGDASALAVDGARAFASPSRRSRQRAGDREP